MSATLQYPTGTPTNSVVLAGPLMGDSKITPQEVKLHMTMGGTIVSTARPEGDNVKFLMTFPNVCETDWTSLLAVIHAANGRPICVMSPSGGYVGYLMNSPIQRATARPDRYSVTVELVGHELVSICLMDGTGYLLMMTGDYILRMEE